MQRTGRKGHAMFRLVVQDARRTPTSGKVVAQLGSYDPHVKTITLDKNKAEFYLEHGAHPSERAARLLKSEGVKLPGWVSLEDKKTGTTRNPDKLRRNRPADAQVQAEAGEVATEAATTQADTEVLANETSETSAEPAIEATTEEPEIATESTDTEEISKQDKK